MIDQTFSQWMAQNYDADELREIAEHGCSDGVTGMTYYTETTSLYDRFGEELWEMLSDDADDFGYPTALSFLASLNGAENVSTPAQAANLIVWYAAERVAQNMTDR